MDRFIETLVSLSARGAGLVSGAKLQPGCRGGCFGHVAPVGGGELAGMVNITVLLCRSCAPCLLGHALLLR